MKKALIALGIVLVLVIGALVALPSLVPADKIKDEVVAQVKAATGRDLSIQGKVSVSAFPSLGVEVSNIALANPPGFSTKDLIRLGALTVKLKLMPLLSGRVEVDSFVLVDPVITLEVDRKGKANWVFDTPAAPNAKPAGNAASDKTAAAGSSSPLGDLVLGDVRIQNGKLSYIDGPAGTREDVDNITLAVTLKSLDDPLSLKGAATWHGKALDIGLNVAKPRALLDGKSTAAEISLNSEVVKLGFKGDALGGAVPGAKGALDLTVPSIRALAHWATGKPLAFEGAGLGPFSVAGQLAASGAKVSLTQAKIALDAIKASGDFSVDASGARPSLKGKLDVEALDLNPYLPPEKPATAGTAAPTAAAPAATGKADWSDAAIDASGLKAADVDFALSVGSILVKKIKVGKSALKVQLANGRLNADLTELALYDGAGKGRVTLDGSQPGIGLDAAFTLKNLKAEPFLTDAADFSRLEGTGNADIQVSGRGRTERQLVSGLNGKGAISFLDGAIKGINLAAMVRNAASAFTSTGSSSEKTDFAELGGTFTITDGIVRNSDLALKSPLLRVEGKGSVELPPRTVHYRVEPKAVASLEGQGGKADMGGIQVPVIIEGSWDNLSYRPDLEAMLKGQAGKAVNDAIGGKAGGLGGLLGGSPGSSGGSSGSEQKSNPLPINPGGLFGR